MKAATPEELNSANKNRREGTKSNRGYKKFIGKGKAQGVLQYVNCAL